MEPEKNMKKKSSSKEDLREATLQGIGKTIQARVAHELKDKFDEKRGITGDDQNDIISALAVLYILMDDKVAKDIVFILKKGEGTELLLQETDRVLRQEVLRPFSGVLAAVAQTQRTVDVGAQDTPLETEQRRRAAASKCQRRAKVR
jgi:hypothetical protein